MFDESCYSILCRAGMMSGGLRVRRMITLRLRVLSPVSKACSGTVSANLNIPVGV